MLKALARPTFCTPRLNVFRVDIKPTDLNHFRAVFLGCQNDDETMPWPEIIATVYLHTPTGHYLEMIESLTHPRNELATELWLGIEQYLGAHLDARAVTDEDAALVAAVRRARGPSVQEQDDDNDPEKLEQRKRAFSQQREIEKRWIIEDQQPREGELIQDRDSAVE